MTTSQRFLGPTIQLVARADGSSASSQKRTSRTRTVSPLINTDNGYRIHLWHDQISSTIILDIYAIPLRRNSCHSPRRRIPNRTVSYAPKAEVKKGNANVRPYVRKPREWSIAILRVTQIVINSNKNRFPAVGRARGGFRHGSSAQTVEPVSFQLLDEYINVVCFDCSIRVEQWMH